MKTTIKQHQQYLPKASALLLGMALAYSSIIQAATPLSDLAMAQPLKGLTKIDGNFLTQVQREARQPLEQQRQTQRALAEQRSQQLRLVQYNPETSDLLRLQRLDRLSTQTRDLNTPTDFLVAQINADEFVRLSLDSLNFAGQEIGVENVKGTVIVTVQINP